jgi:hypothetical protein
MLSVLPVNLHEANHEGHMACQPVHHTNLTYNDTV